MQLQLTENKAGLVGAVGIENNSKWNRTELEEMQGSAKSLQRNNRESSGILIGPSMAPRFFESVKFHPRWFFTHYPR